MVAQQADKFASLLTGNADRSDELADRRQHKLERVSDRFTELAENLERESEKILTVDADKLKNTVRRPEMAASNRELPEDAFQGVEAFRQTCVRTQLIVIERDNA